MSDPDCLFCKILAGTVPADVVAESEHTIAFRDINPQAPIHILVIPREHHVTVADLAVAAPVAAAALLADARSVAEAAGVGEAYRLVFNNGAGVGQIIFHAHAHVLGGRDFTWPPG